MKKHILLVFTLLLFMGAPFCSQAEEQKQEWDIKKIREAFMTDPPWVYEFWKRNGEEKDTIKAACEHLKYFYAFRGAFAAIGTHDNISWRRDVKVMTADVALRILSEESMYLAKLLLQIFDLSNDARREAEPCRNIVSHWDDGVVLASLFVEVLKSGYNNPESIGVSLKTAQEKLINDVHSTLARLAEEALRDPTASTKFQAYLLQAVKNFKFTAQDLTAQERTLWFRLLDGTMPINFWQ